MTSFFSEVSELEPGSRGKKGEVRIPKHLTEHARTTLYLTLLLAFSLIIIRPLAGKEVCDVVSTWQGLEHRVTDFNHESQLSHSPTYWHSGHVHQSLSRLKSGELRGSTQSQICTLRAKHCSAPWRSAADLHFRKSSYWSVQKYKIFTHIWEPKWELDGSLVIYTRWRGHEQTADAWQPDTSTQLFAQTLYTTPRESELTYSSFFTTDPVLLYSSERRNASLGAMHRPLSLPGLRTLRPAPPSTDSARQNHPTRVAWALLPPPLRPNPSSTPEGGKLPSQLRTFHVPCNP